jgi:hypothetical protein
LIGHGFFDLARISHSTFQVGRGSARCGLLDLGEGKRGGYRVIAFFEEMK